MDKEFKQPIFPIGLMLIYIIFGTLGLYSVLGIFAAPFLSIPLVIYMLKRGIPLSSMLISYIVTATGIFIMGFDLNQVLIYFLGVVFSTHVIVYLYRKECTLPEIIVYGTVLFTIGVLVYLRILNYLGVSYAGAYKEMCESYKQLYTQDITAILKNIGVNEAQLGMPLNEVWAVTMEFLKKLFPTVVLLQNFFHMLITVLICNFILKRQIKSLPSIKELMAFKLSKIVLLLFFVTFVMLLTVQTKEVMTTFLTNMLFILMGLLGNVGALSLLGLIQKSRAKGGIRIIGYIIWVCLAIMGTVMPLVYVFFILFACFDTVFNYRKVSIVV